MLQGFVLDCRVGHKILSAQKLENRCAGAQNSSQVHQDAVKGTKVARYMLKTMKMRD